MVPCGAWIPARVVIVVVLVNVFYAFRSVIELYGKRKKLQLKEYGCGWCVVMFVIQSGLF